MTAATIETRKNSHIGDRHYVRCVKCDRELPSTRTLDGALVTVLAHNDELHPDELVQEITLVAAFAVAS